MSNQDASSGEMPIARQSPDELDASLLDALLNGRPLPTDAPEQARAVAVMLASLAGPADPSEWAGEAAARCAFAGTAPRAAGQQPSRRPRPSWLPARVSARLTAGLVAVAIGVGGAAAGYADVLPDPLQDLAHYLLHAPSPRPATRHKQQPPANHKSNAKPGPAKRGTAVSNGNSSHRPMGHHPRPHHHQKASHHRKVNHHRKLNHYHKLNRRHKVYHYEDNRHRGARSHAQGKGSFIRRRPAKP